VAKQILYSEEARRKIQAGLSQLSRAVKSTLGPTGHHAILQSSFGPPKVTKDGVTVSKEIELEDPFENMGAKLVNEVASKTSDVAGDGTTTATVLAEAIFLEGLKHLAAGEAPIGLKRGIDQAVTAVVEQIKKISQPVKDKEKIAQVGAIAANQDPMIGKLLADAVDKVGKDGVITVEEGRSMDTTLEFVEGLQFDKGFISPYFMTQAERREAVLEDCYILLHEKKISSLQEFIPLLEKVAQSGRALFIVAEDVEGESLAALVINKLRGGLLCCAVKAPGFGDRRKEMLQDMAVLTGGEVISEDLGLKLDAVTLDQLGRAKRVIVDKDNTTLVEGAGKTQEVKARINQLRNQIESTTSTYDQEKLTERLAKLVGGVAIVHVGAATEAAMKEKKARVEDALHATRAATEEGVVPGGGVALIRAIPAVLRLAEKLEGAEKAGAKIVAAALVSPLHQIAENCGEDGAVVVEEVKAASGAHGFDAQNRRYRDLLAAGIIDPAKVTRCALENAASIAGLILSTETACTDLKEEEEAVEGSVV